MGWPHRRIRIAFARMAPLSALCLLAVLLTLLQPHGALAAPAANSTAVDVKDLPDLPNSPSSSPSQNEDIAKTEDVNGNYGDLDLTTPSSGNAETYDDLDWSMKGELNEGEQDALGALDNEAERINEEEKKKGKQHKGKKKKEKKEKKKKEKEEEMKEGEERPKEEKKLHKEAETIENHESVGDGNSAKSTQEHNSAESSVAAEEITRVLESTVPAEPPSSVEQSQSAIPATDAGARVAEAAEVVVPAKATQSALGVNVPDEARMTLLRSAGPAASPAGGAAPGWPQGTSWRPDPSAAGAAGVQYSSQQAAVPGQPREAAAAAAAAAAPGLATQERGASADPANLVLSRYMNDVHKFSDTKALLEAVKTGELQPAQDYQGVRINFKVTGFDGKPVLTAAPWTSAYILPPAPAAPTTYGAPAAAPPTQQAAPLVTFVAAPGAATYSATSAPFTTFVATPATTTTYGAGQTATTVTIGTPASAAPASAAPASAVTTPAQPLYFVQFKGRHLPVYATTAEATAASGNVQLLTVQEQSQDLERQQQLARERQLQLEKEKKLREEEEEARWLQIEREAQARRLQLEKEQKLREEEERRIQIEREAQARQLQLEKEQKLREEEEERRLQIEREAQARQLELEEELKQLALERQQLAEKEQSQEKERQLLQQQETERQRLWDEEQRQINLQKENLIQRQQRLKELQGKQEETLQRLRVDQKRVLAQQLLHKQVVQDVPQVNTVVPFVDPNLALAQGKLLRPISSSTSIVKVPSAGFSLDRYTTVPGAAVGVAPAPGPYIANPSVVYSAANGGAPGYQLASSGMSGSLVQPGPGPQPYTVKVFASHQP